MKPRAFVAVDEHTKSGLNPLLAALQTGRLVERPSLV